MTEPRKSPARPADAGAGRIKRRYAAERRFRAYGLAGLSTAVACLVVLLGSIGYQGVSALREAQIRLEIDFDAEYIDPDGRRDPEVLRDGNYQALARRALAAEFPAVTTHSDRTSLYALLSSGTGLKLRDMVLEDPSLLGRVVDSLKRHGVDEGVIADVMADAAPSAPGGTTVREAVSPVVKSGRAPAGLD